MREDFERIRAAVERTSPDLVVWQIGTGDALAGTSEASFADTLDQAGDWLRGRNIDLVLVDPPFLPDVGMKPAMAASCSRSTGCPTGKA